MAKLSARGCTVLARVERDEEVAEGRVCRFYLAMRSDGRILSRARWLGADGHATGWELTRTEIPTNCAGEWIDSHVASGWSRS